MTFLDTLYADTRFALRNLIKHPGFTFFAVFTIALGLGANLAIFSFLDGVLLKPLPYPEPEKLVQLWEKPPGFDRNGISAANFLDWQRQAKSFTAMAASTGGGVTMTGFGEPRNVRGSRVSAPYFRILGVQPAAGRTFADGEDQPGKDHVVVITNRFYQNVLGGAPGIVGSKLNLDDEPYTVIGILPANSEFDRRFSDIYRPLSFKPDSITRNFHFLTAIARLKPGVTIEQARAEMSAIAARIAELYPDVKKGWGATTDRLVDRAVGDQLRRSLIVLMVAVGAVLLIGCANLANLLLARGTLRSREIALRTSLGAPRSRLVRQLLTESLILSGFGAIASVGVGYALFRGIRALLPPFFLPSAADVSIDWRMLVFLATLTILTSVLFGLVPALQNSRTDPVEALREGGRGSSSGRGRHWLRNSLIVGEVTLAFILLAGAGLMIRSFDRLSHVDMGFDSSNLISMYLPLVMEKDIDGARLTTYLNQILENVGAAPGVTDAAFTTAVPMRGWGFGMPFRLSGSNTPHQDRPAGFFKMVTPGYFGALRMPLRKGRYLQPSDVKGSSPAMVVNQRFVERFLKDKDPLGQHVLVEEIVTGKTELGPEIPWEIVGVVANEKVGSMDSTDAGMYVTYAQSPVVGVSLIARTATEPERGIKSIQQAVWRVNRNQALDEPITLERIKSDNLASARLRTALLGLFAGLALLLAVIGIYAVLWYVTAERTKELGIRIALGASSWDVVRLVVTSATKTVALGLALGVGGALALSSLVKSLLFNTSPNDPGTLTAVGLLLLAVALTACYLPARSAARVDPVNSLRQE